MKYMGTNFMADNKTAQAYKNLKGREVHQMRIVVKSKGRKDAERICKENGLRVTFEPNYSCETFNKDEIEFCNKSDSGIILSCICSGKNDIVTLEQIKEVNND